MKVVKTIKLFIGGDFVRSESGRTFLSPPAEEGSELVRVSQASRKDVRQAVEVAKTGLSLWRATSAYLRGQILYRMAEMCASRREEFCSLFITALGLSSAQAQHEFEEGLARILYYAGFCDKYQQIASSLNPVSGPYHHVTSAEPCGVVALIEGDTFSFARLCDQLCAILAGGNSLVVVLGQGCPPLLAPLAEVLATCDLPRGSVALLAGELSELLPCIAGHYEIQAVCFLHEDQQGLQELQQLGALNLKRITAPPVAQPPCLEAILAFVEFKSLWHPLGY